MRVLDTLKKHLTQAQAELSRHRLDLLSSLMPALIQVRSVNLMKVATAMPGPANKMSRYRRVQRFFSSGVSPDVFTPLILNKVIKPGKQLFLTLTMDRTHWKWGQTDLNLLCLGLLHQDVSIPLESVSLGKAGNSNTKERKKLFRKAWQYLKSYSCCLLADREFIGTEWLAFLLGLPGLDFIIRIRCEGWITLPNGTKRYLSHLVRNLPKGKTRIYENVTLYEQSDQVRVHLVCHRSEKGELVLLATNRSDLHQVRAIYKKRWSIETAFGFLKSKGFDLEETHLTKPKRIQLLLGVLSLTLLWGLLVGLEADRHKPIPVKNHGRKTISFVRLGLDHLQDSIGNFDHQWKEFRHYCRLLLSCT
jgi:hypothetical protein